METDFVWTSVMAHRYILLYSNRSKIEFKLNWQKTKVIKKNWNKLKQDPNGLYLSYYEDIEKIITDDKFVWIYWKPSWVDLYDLNDLHCDKLLKYCKDKKINLKMVYTWQEGVDGNRNRFLIFK